MIQSHTGLHDFPVEIYFQFVWRTSWFSVRSSDRHNNMSHRNNAKVNQSNQHNSDDNTTCCNLRNKSNKVWHRSEEGGWNNTLYFYCDVWIEGACDPKHLVWSKHKFKARKQNKWGKATWVGMHGEVQYCLPKNCFYHQQVFVLDLGYVCLMWLTCRLCIHSEPQSFWSLLNGFIKRNMAGFGSFIHEWLILFKYSYSGFGKKLMYSIILQKTKILQW